MPAAYTEQQPHMQKIWTVGRQYLPDQSQHTEGNSRAKLAYASDNSQWPLHSHLPCMAPTCFQALMKRQYLCLQIAGCTCKHDSSQPGAKEGAWGGRAVEPQSSSGARRQGCQATAYRGVGGGKVGEGVKTGKGNRYKLHLSVWGNGSLSICVASCSHWVMDFVRQFGHKCFLHHELQSAPQGGCNRENRKEYFLSQLVVMDNTARTAAGRFSKQLAPR